MFAVLGVEPPLHEYVPPPVAVTDIFGVVQVKTVVPELLVMPAVGGVLFSVIVMLAVFVQPFAVFVTVTQYVPAEVKVLLAVLGVEPPLHEYVPSPVAVTDILGVVQVKTVVPELLVMPALGGVLFSVNVMLELFVQPFAGFVTVTVYVVADERV